MTGPFLLCISFFIFSFLHSSFLLWFRAADYVSYMLAFGRTLIYVVELSQILGFGFASQTLGLGLGLGLDSSGLDSLSQGSQWYRTRGSKKLRIIPFSWRCPGSGQTPESIRFSLK